MKFLTTTALALALSTPMALAQQADDSGMTDMSDGSQLIRTRDITGGEIYTMNATDDEGWDTDFMHDEVNANWNQIGTIEDIVLSESGEVVGIVAEIGGFLDIGDKHVMIEVADLNLVAVDDMTYTYVTRHSEEMLEEMESVDEGFWN